MSADRGDAAGTGPGPSAGRSSYVSASVLARDIAARRRSPVDVVDGFLKRIAEHDGRLNAYVAVHADQARAAARAAECAIRAGHSVGPYHGMPIALKDLVELEGSITTGGSAHFRGRRSTVTASLARRLIAQGMIVLGKTHTTEFAFSGWGINRHMGTPWNPWDLTCARTPGGSSSGSGVAVAAGLAPWAIGTDTGGSVRLPAAFCGVTGLKTTIGRISAHGVMPLSRTLDTPGVLARDVMDAALLFNVLQGPDLLDPNTRGILPENPLPTLGRGVRGLRLARMPLAERAGVDDEVLAAYDRSLEVLARAGAEIVAVELPFRFKEWFAVHQQIVQAEAYAVYGGLVDDEAAVLDETLRKGVRLGRDISAHAYLSAQARRMAMKEALHRALSDVHALLTPTTETAALPLGEVSSGSMPSRFTRFVNGAEMCALAIPNGATATGLPVSLQVVCRGFEEAMALRIGQTFQLVTDHHLRAPAHGPRPAVGTAARTPGQR